MAHTASEVTLETPPIMRFITDRLVERWGVWLTRPDFYADYLEVE